MIPESIAPTASAALIDQTAAAELLGLRNPKTLAIWRVRRQGPPYCKIGKSVRYEVRALLAYIAANTVSNQSGSADIQAGVDVQGAGPIGRGCPQDPDRPKSSPASSASRRGTSPASLRRAR